MTQRRPRLALCAIAGLACSQAAAQQQQDLGPIVVGQREGLRGLELRRLDAAINLEGRYRRDDRTNPDQTQEERRLRGDLELDGRVFVGHENLLDINGVVRLGIEQLDIESDVPDQSRTDVSTFNLFDISGLFLADSMAPTTVYAFRDQALIDREFSGTVDSTTTEYGVRTNLRLDAAPTFLQYFHREVDQDDQQDLGDYNLVQDTFAARTELRSERQLFEADYTFDSVTETQGSGFQNTYDRHNLILSHRIDFDEFGRYSLRSQGRYYDQSGLSPLTQFRIDELLRLRHTDRFETRYNLIFDDQDRDTESQQFLQGTAALTHRLYDSLTTDATVGANRLETTGDFTSDAVFGDLLAQYEKSAPYGRIDASGRLAYEVRDDSERGDPLSIVDRPIALNGAPSVINQNNILVGSVMVTNLTGTRTYVEGLDYTVRYLPDRVEIRRIVGGAIASGETVLVDYIVGPQPAATIDTLTKSISFRYTLEEGTLRGLGGYVNYTETDNGIESDAPEQFLLDDIRDLLYGVEYRRNPFYLMAERQERDSDLAPFDSTRLEARYDQRLGISSALSASLSYEVTDYPLDDDQLRITRAITRWYGQVLPELGLNLRLEFRDEQSRQFGDSTGYEGAFEVNWRRRQTSVSASLRSSYLDSDQSDTFSQVVLVELRREF
ncbi:MAG: hypothetical protein ACF8R7_17985 [Phycisphaerales bacterium JB039]